MVGDYKTTIYITSLLPIFVISSYFSFIGNNLINIPSLIFCSLGVLFAHIATNMYNDYFDNLDGTDEKNNEYFQQLSGGSRAIELGLIALEKTKTCKNFHNYLNINGSISII